MNRASPAVTALLLVNAAVFAVSWFAPQLGEQVVARAAFWFPKHPNHAAWQAVSYMFLHAGIGHLFFNMFALASFGMHLERAWGSARFLVFYFLCGLGAGLIQIGVNLHQFAELREQFMAAGMRPAQFDQMLATGRLLVIPGTALQESAQAAYSIYAAPMLGASGAVYGILVAFGMLYPNARLALLFLPFPIAAKFFIPILIVLDLLSGITGFSLFGVGIAHFAHVGGALIGFLLMLLWRHRRAPAARAPDSI